MAISGGDGSIILTTKVDETGLKKSLGSMGKTAKSFGAGVAKSFAAIGVAAATATVAITKMAVSAYSEFEQLAGGVQKIFDQANIVQIMEDANAAFLDLGMSANDYLRTINDIGATFSATMGDQKGYDIARQGLLAISDYASGTGKNVDILSEKFTMITRSASSYQSIADQFSGILPATSADFLAQAKAAGFLSNQYSKLTEVPIAEYQQAVTQMLSKGVEELGLMGNTAAEAATTISGSANMMKAAWQNVLSAIAGGGDLDRAINNLVYSISVYFANIVPVVERSLVGIGKLIEQVAPMLVQNVASALIQSIPSLINAIYQMIIGLAKGIWAGIKALFTGGTAQIGKQVSTVGTGGGISGGGVSSGGSSGGSGGSGGGSAPKGKSAEEQQIDAEEKAIQDKIKALQKENKQINKNDKANQKANQKQLASFDDITTLGSNQMSEADAMIDKNNEEIDQLQEQLDLLRDKKQVLQDVASASGTGGGISTPSIGGISGGGIGGFDFGMEEQTNEISGFASVMQEHFAKIAEIAKTVWDSTPIQAFVTAAQTILGTVWNFTTTMWDDIKTNFSTTWQNIQGDFSTIIQNLTTLWTQYWNDMNVATQTWGQPIIDSISGLFNSIWSTAIDPFIQLVTGVWADFTGILVDLWNEHGATLLNNVGEFAYNIIGLFQSIYDNILEPIITPFLETLSWLWEEHLSKLVYAVGDFIGSLVNGALEIYNKFIDPIVKWLIEFLAPGFTNAFNTVVDILGTVIAFIVDFATAVIKQLTGTVDFITGIFTGNWEKAWNGITEFFEGIVDAWVGLFKGAINLIIDLINGLTGGWSAMALGLSKIPGFEWAENLQIPKIPKLAQGAVIPPNREFLAVLGDQKHGTNIEAPADLIKQKVMEAMIEMSGNFGGGNAEVVLEIDGREFGRAVVEQGNRENRRIGTRLVIA